MAKMSMNKRLQGLYVITDPELCKTDIITQAEQALSGGAQIVQYRNKTATAQQKQQEAMQLNQLCQKHHRVFIINDDVALAKMINADGVHIGQSDTTLKQARTILGKEKIIGVSCNNQLDWALTAQQQGADYVAFGRFFASQTKPLAPPATMDLLIQAKQQLDIPIVAIGGITPDNAPELVQAGADMLALINGIFAQPDICRAAQQIQQHFICE